MTRVLLITDSERVLRVFESLETKGLLQLKTVATLPQGEQEISASPPDVTFIQGRISGVCGEIELRHLRKVLPKGAKAVLLAGEAIDAAQAKKDGRLCIDLSLDDDELEAVASAVLTGGRLPAPKKGRGRSKGAPSAPVDSAAAEEKDLRDRSVTDLPPEETDDPEAEEPTFEVALRETGTTEAESFAEVMRRGSAKLETSGPNRLEVEDRVDLGSRFPLPQGDMGAPLRAYLEPDIPLSMAEYLHGEPLADAIRRAEEKKRPTWVLLLLLVFILIPLLSYLAGRKKATAPPPVNLVTTSASRQLKHPGKAQAPSSAKAPLSKTQAAGQAQSSALSAALTTALSTVPVIGPGMTAPAMKPASVPVAQPAAAPVVKPEVKPAAKPAPLLLVRPMVAVVAKPEAKPEAKPLAKPLAKAPEAKPAAPAPVNAMPAAPAKPQPNAAPQPAARAGAKAMPSAMAAAKLDAAYGKAHPGWQRLTDPTAEYKVYKEGNLYRAVQVIAQGKESVPIALFRQLLQEFGGVSRFRVESTEKNGDYLLERGAAEGGLAITIYRKKNDHRMKGVVLYYR